ncbi:sphingomyelin phosphodiesterase-like [Ptychodera flava]|uniref:sphingomyelin phosphodiesterase-like n=1 Tax=Ptychodera flava TaxID=63121 RepID=UPI00396A541B
MRMERRKCLQFLCFPILAILIVPIDAAALRFSSACSGGDNDVLLNSLDDVTAPSWLTCELCKFSVTLVQTRLKENVTRDEIVKEAIKICIKLEVEDERVCELVIPEFQDWFITVVQKLIFSPDELCGLMLGSDCAKPYNPFEQWNITLPDTPKPPVFPPKPPKHHYPKERVLHISDIHYDKEYSPGSNAECGEPICCRVNDGKPPEGHEGAGKWGDYRNCDASKLLLENMFQHLHRKEKFDYAFFTGDIPAHDVWNQTEGSQLEALHTVTHYFKKYLGDTPIFPAVGNHESAPANNFPSPSIDEKHSIQWLYNALADTWIQKTGWLPENTRETIKKGGYYSTQIKPGLQLASINTMYCYNLNFWLYLNTTDPADQLQWLISVLQSAEDSNEKVFIIGHIPPGIDDCLKRWSWNYYTIVNRYESTIAGQFFGHTHTDSFQVFYDEETLSRPLSVAYIAGSVTTQPTLNPAYRVYQIDGDYEGSSRMVLNHHTFIMNITDVNLTDKPEWRREYSARDAYDMEYLFPCDWHAIIQEFKRKDDLFNKYYTFFYKSHVSSICDASCRARMICDLQSGRSHDPSLCNITANY